MQLCIPKYEQNLNTSVQPTLADKFKPTNAINNLSCWHRHIQDWEYDVQHAVKVYFSII